MPKVTHSESAFQGVRVSSHSRKHGLLVESRRQEGSKTTYQEGDIALSEASRVGSLLGTGYTKSSAGRGILERTAFLARRASTSKFRLKKGSRAVLKPGR